MDSTEPFLNYIVSPMVSSGRPGQQLRAAVVKQSLNFESDYPTMRAQWSFTACLHLEVTTDEELTSHGCDCEIGGSEYAYM